MTNEEIGEQLHRVINVLEESQSWLRLMAIGDLKSRIESTFGDEWEYELYDRINGDRTIDELIEGLPISSSTTSRRLRSWYSMGIARKTDDGKYEHLALLDDIGLEIPEGNDNE